MALHYVVLQCGCRPPLPLCSMQLMRLWHSLDSQDGMAKSPCRILCR
jgi:hypothetical protein